MRSVYILQQINKVYKLHSDKINLHFYIENRKIKSSFKFRPLIKQICIPRYYMPNVILYSYLTDRRQLQHICQCSSIHIEPNEYEIRVRIDLRKRYDRFLCVALHGYTTRRNLKIYKKSLTYTNSVDACICHKNCRRER